MTSLASKSIIILLCLLQFLQSIAQSPGLELDAAALLNFKASINDIKNNLKSWSRSNSSSTCQWRGIRCDESNRVVELDLSSMQLSCDASLLQASTLPQELRNLSLAGNDFTGPIESLLASITPSTPCKLELLDLSSNSLTGSFSTFNSCQVTLTVLNLSRNRLEGLSLRLGVWDRLRSLDLSNNFFTGQFTVPSSLQELQLSNNRFSELENLPEGCMNLIQLDISNNSFTDFTNLLGCKSLRKLSLASNPFSSRENFSIWEPLEFLDASENGFTGSISIPKTLKFLDLSSNKLVLGSNPGKGLCSSDSALTTLLLLNNNLTGRFPESILTCSSLQTLDLSYNPSLSGQIPADICTNLLNLRELIISRGNLSDTLPPELSRCSNLVVLLLNKNKLSGSIPPEFGSLTGLQWLSLSDNELTGTIPPSLGSLRNLTFLELSNNKLVGDISNTFAGNSSGILWLDLSNNRFTGFTLGRFGFKDSPKPFPRSFLSGGEMAYAMNSPNCSGGLGRLLLIQKKGDEKFLSNCRNSRLYPISSYNLTNRPIQSAVFLDLSFNELTGELLESIGEVSDLTIMDLRSNKLTGSLPPTIGHLRGLLMLDLSNNRFQGELDSLCNLTFLSSLNVSFNNFSGTIPTQGQLTTFSNESYAGNPYLSGYRINNSSSNNNRGESPTFANRKQPHIIAQQLLVVLLVSGILFLAATGWWIWRRKHKILSTKSSDDSPGISPKEPQAYQDQPTKISYQEIKQATQSFQYLIGSGGSAQVFQGQLSDGSRVAVKRLTSSLASDEFQAEIRNLGRICHANLLPLRAFGSRGEEHFLVYPLMANGTLENLLSDPTLEIPWNIRKRIATDAAKGLCFLHHTCAPHIVHRDVTSANVLLDDAWNARLADFSMARLMQEGHSGGRSDYVSVTTLWGTPGYVAPEYYQSFFRCTRGGDVYSYGVILLELLTRKRATGKEYGESNLIGWARGMKLEQDIIQQELRSSSGAKEVEEMLVFVRLAMECVEDRPQKRPTMLQVVARLKELSLES